MPQSWSTATVDYLLRFTACPRCNAPLDDTVCRRCGADLSGDLARDLAAASHAAADAIRARQVVIDRLPTREVARPTAVTVETRAPIRALTPLPEVRTSPPRASAQISVQSVLAVAGAGLFAIAAIVFTFLNPDLTDFTTRSLIVGGVTAVFLLGAWFLGRTGLRFSAETVAALGTVFIALDVWAFATGVIPGANAWLVGGIATALVSAALVYLAWLSTLRTWLWLGFVGLAVSPALVGYAFASPWSAVLGHFGVAVIAMLLHSLARAAKARFSSPLLTERTTATALQLAASVIVFTQAFFIVVPDNTQRALGSAAFIAALALLSGFSARNQLRTVWSVAAGVLSVVAVVPLPSLDPSPTDAWITGSIPVVAALVLAALSLAVARGPWRGDTQVNRPALLLGGWAVTLIATIPAASAATGEFLVPLYSGIDPDTGVAAMVGLGAAAAATGVLAAGSRILSPALSRRALVTALWLTAGAILSVVAWTGFARVTQVTLGVVIALATVVLVSRINAWPLARRAPLFVLPHALLLFAAAVVWADPWLSVIGGAAIAASVFAVSRVAVPATRPLYTALGYAFALVVLAVGLVNTDLEAVAVLCLTSAIGSATALGITLLKRVPATHWYAVLAVTIVPFGIGILSVLIEIRGWAALSTAAMFALALTLVLTRRPGLGRLLRSAAAALLVPTLAVVVVCLGGWLLAISASPVTLPIIAVIVAVILPLTTRIGRALEVHGLRPIDARDARVWIEISSLVTAAIAVLLALVRTAAGLPTSFQVLVIIAIGALAARLITRRRYAGYVAFAGFTGALWCLLAMADVTVLEPYTLPPALAAAIIGAIAALRGLGGRLTYALGLAFAVAPSLLLVITAGRYTDAPAPPRTAALLIGALALLLLGAWMQRRRDPGRAAALTTLALPTLLLSGVAAAAGAAQGVRLGWRLDAIAEPSILPALGVSALGAALAAAAAVVAGRDIRSRWLLAPALVMLAAGPIAAVNVDTTTVTVLWLLMVAVLMLMLVTVIRARTREVLLPPVWFTFAVAWLVAVTAWSTREFLRVEAFSLVLGVALLAAGVLAMRQTSPTTPGVTSWPNGFSGSWRLLTPGIVVTLLPSVLATGTDPQTWRAVLVIALALTAILVGSLRKLAAPFIIGLVALPVENAMVFAVQIGRGIEASTWWITLATAGAVLLIIAVTSERRSSAERGVAARLRDLT